MKMKKYLVVLSFLASCNGVGQYNMDGPSQGQSTQGVGVSSNVDSSSNLHLHSSSMNELLPNDLKKCIYLNKDQENNWNKYLGFLSHVKKLKECDRFFPDTDSFYEFLNNLVSNWVSGHKEIPIHYLCAAVEENFELFVRALLLCPYLNIDRSIRTPFGESGTIGECIALYAAVEKGYIKIARILLDNNANPNVFNKRTKKYPLCKAIIDGRLDMVKLLVAKGAEINIKNTRYMYAYSPLEWARDMLKEHKGTEKEVIYQEIVDFLDLSS